MLMRHCHCTKFTKHCTNLRLLSKHVRGESKIRPGLEVTRDTFLGGLGCFEHVNETKLGDRIGLAFSQTIPIDELKQERVKVIPGKL